MRTGEAAAKANQTRELLLVAVAAAVAETNAGAALGGASIRPLDLQVTPREGVRIGGMSKGLTPAIKHTKRKAPKT